jgi:hypothetical protein
MTITALPTPPSRSDTPATFISRADALLAALPTFVTETNASAAAMNLNATSDTSATSNAIGTGAKTFTVSAGKSFLGGMFLVIADTAAPSTNYMVAQVTSYSGTSLVVNVISVGGSGTKTAWTISQSAATTLNEARGSVAMHATTMDLWTQPAIIDGTSAAVTVTAIANAPQAGTRRVLYPVAGSIITNGATFAVDGAANATAEAGDAWEFEAVTTSTYKVHITKKSGKAVAAAPIQSISASVGSNALTISASTLSLDFRSATLGSGTVTTVSGAPANLVISSGSTLGTVSGQQSRIAVLALNNAGTIELAAVNIAGGVDLSETGLISTTAEGGAGAADSATVIYSTTARSSLSYRVIGYIESTQATAGTWATAPSVIQGAGGNALIGMSGFGFGQTWQSVTRNASTTYYNTTGKPIIFFTSIATSNTVTMTIGGVALPAVSAGSTGNGLFMAIIPPGMSYSFTGTLSGLGTHELR